MTYLKQISTHPTSDSHSYFYLIDTLIYGYLHPALNQISMADHAVEDNYFDGDIFVYRGGRAPRHVTHVLIDESVEVIEVDAFGDCLHLV